MPKNKRKFLNLLKKKAANSLFPDFSYAGYHHGEKNIPKVLCAASRVYDEKKGVHTYSFLTKSPSNTNNVMRVLLPSKPLSVVVKDADGKPMENKNEWDEISKTSLLKFINSADGINVEIKW